jgi:hypothetical protein
MVDKPYSGSALRAAHFASRPPVPGLNVDHTKPNPEPDIFNPVPDVAPGATHGTVWANEANVAGPSNQPNFAQVPVSHWFDGQPAVPSGEPYARAQQAMQERMFLDHSVVSFVPDGIRLYQHVTEGQRNEFNIGRGSQFAGASIPDGPLAALGNGRNAYDQINKPNEVYVGDPANVGRYRLGVKTNIYGLYDTPLGKFGQDALLHAFTGLTPAAPFEKEPMTDTAPYTPNSTGTAHWSPAAPYQVPSMFSLPSETGITDYAVAADDTAGSDFTERNGGFH